MPSQSKLDRGSEQQRFRCRLSTYGSAWVLSGALLGTLACSETSDGVTVFTPKAPGAIVVYRDGDAAWTATTGASGSVYFPAPSGTYTVVVGCNFGQQSNVSVYALTTAELSTIDYQGECGGERQALSGFTNHGPSAAFLYFGQTGATFVGSSASYMLEGPRGTGDLLAQAGARVVVMRDISLGASPVSLDVDFYAPHAADLRQHRLTLSSIDELETTAYGALWTQGGTYASLCSSNGATVCGLPAPALAAGDLHVLGVVSRGTGPYRHARWAVHEPTDREIIFPLTTLIPPQVTVTTQQTKVVMSVTWPEAPSAPLYRVVASQTSGPPPYRFWQLVASEGFVSGGGDISLPDLSGVAGWDPALELIGGSFLEWQVVAEKGAALDELMRWYPTLEGTVLADGFSGSQTPQ